MMITEPTVEMRDLNENILHKGHLGASLLLSEIFERAKKHRLLTFWAEASF
jgi:hypothetical protein